MIRSIMSVLDEPAGMADGEGIHMIHTKGADTPKYHSTLYFEAMMMIMACLLLSLNNSIFCGVAARERN